jgi:orotidine 5'-phosphate decarboxylase subfamily 2
MPGCWERIAEASVRNNSLLCVGLDIDPQRLPEKIKAVPDPIYSFNCAVIEATLDLVCCYKPNVAFYEAQGAEGLDALVRTIRFVNGRVPVILDIKRGDIGNTATQYARAAFEWFGADAVTVNPYLGLDSVAPFMEFPDKGIFVLCLTSNPGSADFQLLPNEDPLYERVAAKVRQWDEGKGCLGLVVGATHPERIARLREISGGLPFLLPGIGAQGGSLEAVSAAALPGQKLSVVVNASRSVIYASGEADDFTVNIREAARELRDRLGGSFSDT